MKRRAEGEGAARRFIFFGAFSFVLLPSIFRGLESSHKSES
jgi:hypothetical protein